VSRTAFLCFERELSQKAFDDLVEAMVSQNDARFHLWGNPIRLGPRKVHIYGADTAAWTPVSIEMRADRAVLLVDGKNRPETEQEIIDRFASDLRRYLRQEISVKVCG